MIEPGAWIWTRRQRLVLAMLVLTLALIFGLRAVRRPARIADPPGEGAMAGDLATRIDPNTADWAAWAALPLIGERRAKEIVAFRDGWQADHPGETCFEKLDDLTRIKGIGKATITTLEPYLDLPKMDGEEK